VKNFKIFYEKNDEESWEELIESEPKERRNRKFREKREKDSLFNSVRHSQWFISDR
jgi:hypothetical protein